MCMHYFLGQNYSKLELIFLSPATLTGSTGKPGDFSTSKCFASHQGMTKLELMSSTVGDTGNSNEYETPFSTPAISSGDREAVNGAEDPGPVYTEIQ